MRGRARAGDEVAGRYVLLERIGAGGMGVVWRANDRRLNRMVALKCARLDDERAVERLKAEARNAASLHHPHIVAVFDHVEDDEGCWLVMEYVPSRSLAQILAEDGPLPPEGAAAIGWQIADALEAAHVRGVVHGDVTPENILVTDEGIAKLADFGISRVTWTDATQQSITGGVQGKPRYIAPEVANGEPVTRASDRFSLGASLFAAVEGRSPYGEAAHPMAFIGRAMAGRIEEPVRAGRLTGALTALLRLEPGSRPVAGDTRRALGDIAPPSAAVRKLHALAPATEAGADGAATEAGPDGADGAATEAGPDSAADRAASDSAADRAARPGPGGGPGPDSGHAPRKRWIAAGSVVLVAALAAALLVVRPWDDGSGGAAVADDKAPTSSAAGHASVRPSALGDARTADPCSLLAPAALKGFGGTELATAYGNFDRCDILVEGPGKNSSADVAATFIGTDVETGTQVRTRKAGNVTVAEEPLDGDECDRTLRLGDGNHVQIMARRTDDASPDLCAMADAATEHAVSVLADRGTVPRRPSAAAADSLAAADACALLTPAALARVKGVDPADHDADFADWGCHWGSSSGDTGVDLVFDRNSPPLDGSDGEPVRLGPKKGFLAADYEDDGTCTARIVSRTYKDLAGEPTQELVELTVAGPDACASARDLGEVAAAKLPD
ncbi:serine/threonine-protein kinase [Actinacidiphila alni]|uniref:serine/threonine-protein kinase n=1 Tax=Actinacidiphila alni TaxID=380248 RepID=UPI0033E795C3